MSIVEASEATLARYRSRTGRRKNGQLRAAGRGLAKVLRLLRPQPAEGQPSHAARTEGEELVCGFDSHLQHVAGCMPGTRSQYLRHATLFVNAVFGTAAFDVAKVTPQAITDFVREQETKGDFPGGLKDLNTEDPDVTEALTRLKASDRR